MHGSRSSRGRPQASIFASARYSPGVEAAVHYTRKSRAVPLVFPSYSPQAIDSIRVSTRGLLRGRPCRFAPPPTTIQSPSSLA